MKAGDVSGGQTSSRESWLSAPLSDPNAALWASITPPANPDLATIVRRRAAAFSLDLLAQRLYLGFPAFFSSRSTARTAILAATVAFGAALGTAGYLALGPRQPLAAAAPAARAAKIVITRAAMPMSRPAATSVMWCMPRNIRDHATKIGIATTSAQSAILSALFLTLDARTMRRPPSSAMEAAVCPDG